MWRECWFTIAIICINFGSMYSLSSFISIVTYGVFGVTSKSHTVSVNHVSTYYIWREIGEWLLIDNFDFQCKGISKGADSLRFFIQVRDYPLQFQVNLSEGIFHNKPLFDKTVGVSRRMLSWYMKYTQNKMFIEKHVLFMKND